MNLKLGISAWLNRFLGCKLFFRSIEQKCQSWQIWPDNRTALLFLSRKWCNLVRILVLDKQTHILAFLTYSWWFAWPSSLPLCGTSRANQYLMNGEGNCSVFMHLPSGTQLAQFARPRWIVICGDCECEESWKLYNQILKSQKHGWILGLVSWRQGSKRDDQ